MTQSLKFIKQTPATPCADSPKPRDAMTVLELYAQLAVLIADGKSHKIPYMYDAGTIGIVDTDQHGEVVLM